MRTGSLILALILTTGELRVCVNRLWGTFSTCPGVTVGEIRPPSDRPHWHVENVPHNLLAQTPSPPAAPPVGTDAVDALLKICSDAGVIVADKDPETGKAPTEPTLGISKFIVPDETKLRATLHANKALMANEKSRKALIGCAKLASREFAPGWVDLLRAVGREHDDNISIKISYNIAATHDLLPGDRQGFADLKTLVNEAIKNEVVQFHPGKANGLAWLTVRDEAKFRSLLESNRKLLGPGLVGAAARMSLLQCDHTPVLTAIAALTNDAGAKAYGAEFTARDYRSQLKPQKAAEELAIAAKNFELLCDLPSQARALTQLGEVRRELGEEEAALDHFSQAYGILDLVHEGSHRNLVVLKRLQAEIYCDRHETQRALVAYMKAITMFMKLPPERDKFDEPVKMMRLMSRVDLRLGYPEDARERLTDILFLLDEVDRQIKGADNQAIRALTLRDLGLLELRRARFDEAKSRLDAALDIQMRREGAVHPETIKTLMALGQVCAARDEPGQSEFFTRQATIFLVHHYGTKHPEVVKAWSDRAAIQLAHGNYRDASTEVAYGLEAARINTGNKVAVAEDFLPTRETVLLLARRGELSLLGADQSKERDGQLRSLRHAREHFVLAEGVFNRIRGKMPGNDDRLLAGDEAPDFFLGQLACHARLSKLEPIAAQDSATAFAIAERATAHSLLDTLGDDIASRLNGVPEELRLEYRQLQMKLGAAVGEYSQAPFQETQTRPSTEQQAAWDKYVQTERELKQFEKRVAKKYPTPSRETGVAVSAPEQALASLDPKEVAVTFLTGSKESFAVVLSRGPKGPEVTVHTLPGRDTLDDQIATLIRPEVMDQAMGRRLGDRLYDQLLQPLHERITGKHLVIVPTGPLCRLPFELLRGPSSEGRQYLGLTHRIRYAPSLTVLRLLQERDRTLLKKPDLALWAMGNPDNTKLPPLPGAVVEVGAIAALLKADMKNVRLGPAATKNAMLEASSNGVLKRHRILHFAVHAGFMSEGNPMPGLVLRGERNQSGFLDMDEIAHLDLNADLVVLSACSSNGGRIYGGEGIRGLTGSFLVAGGRAVVATQWELADKGAAPFMEAFYARLKTGMTPVDALWETRREVARRAEPLPPSLWAAFILVGN